MKRLFFLFLFSVTIYNISYSSEPAKKDVIETSAGKLSMTFLGHASILLEWNNKTIFIDPWGEQADFSKQPKADLILITHEHKDHLDENAINTISKPGTQIICNPAVFNIIKKGQTLKNGENKTWEGIRIEAVPAYNTTAGRDKFHPKGRDNGYVITVGDKKIYVAGDTEDIPEMNTLKNINIAILPMNQPYTMTPEQVIKAVAMIHPAILYPYHTDDADIATLSNLMSSQKQVELRVRTNK